MAKNDHTITRNGFHKFTASIIVRRSIIVVHRIWVRTSKDWFRVDTGAIVLFCALIVILCSRIRTPTNHFSHNFIWYALFSFEVGATRKQEQPDHQQCSQASHGGKQSMMQLENSDVCSTEKGMANVARTVDLLHGRLKPVRRNGMVLNSRRVFFASNHYSKRRFSVPILRLRWSSYSPCSTAHIRID